MAKTSKKQIGFYADPDIEDFLEQLDPGVKTRTINAALRAWKESRLTVERPIYEDRIESLVSWLNVLRPPITVNNSSGQLIALSTLLERFLSQERQRSPNQSWAEIVSKGITFAAPTTRCNSCQRSLLAGEGINTPSRGTLCRSCFEIPFPKTHRGGP